MWDVAAPGSNTLTFDDTVDYAAVLASVSESRGGVEERGGNEDMSPDSRDKRDSTAEKHGNEKEAVESRSHETESRPGWFGRGSIWGF